MGSISDDSHAPAAGASPQQKGYARHPLHERYQRPLHVILIGAGPSGIAMLIALKRLPHVTFHCFEKNHQVGGTWLENRYPGAACDVASHAYQYTFESKKDWTRHFAPAEEIGEYFISVAEKHELHRHISFNSRVIKTNWQEKPGKWTVHVCGDSGIVEQHDGDILINASGILNDWKWPDIKGLNTFKGHLVHTAAWDSSLDFTGKTVAVIGSGASSIQVVPKLQPAVKRLEVFVRSPTYILPTVGFGIESATYNQTYTQEQIDQFTQDPEYYRDFRKRIEQQMNENFAGSIKSSKEQAKGRLWAEDMMRKAIKSPELQDKLIPSWELGCRRVTPGKPYLEAVQEPNVDVVREGISRIAADGLITEDGVMHDVDVIVCATGFDTSRGPESYLGIATAGLPNHFTFLGPNCPIANGSLVPCIESRSVRLPEPACGALTTFFQILTARANSVKYISQVLVKMQKDQIKSVNVKQAMQDAFNEYTQSVHQDLVWTGSCQSWYKDRATGRVVAVWPGSSIHYMDMIETPRWEDYEIQYMHSNPFFFMGNGTSQREARGEDLTFCKLRKIVFSTWCVVFLADA
ncbi:hypothetical protein Micbo1qcDRAFT_223282 [Microdochium bolleyi]|uniref:FAD/NAD(P)-binding domain-containing protein n=1 Tax=Microdochium bolleyi TaxID=196109 RepID=A0A136IKR0_9PEZI|nr:hypothetical protein Micbo1qcDRAFT_223282 [Microdochium bolleyi]